ncbi:ABC transporter substrate-binding protein [Glycomyces xiaoerkulensis]|uniref:ABC transporter substrate-binding protein n=1 Tax=Glycomyces xiaoerkulensis TaxID=2038139 RepID=UPI000C25E135|nr:ABC transporter substrate-binding protein [Glycomyces xiaoerkulensis]
MKTVKRYAAIPAIAVMALAGCAGGADTLEEGSDGLTEISIGISPFQDTYLPIIGEEQGWFEEAGLDVELKSLAWNGITPALVSGDVDMAVNNTTGVVSTANSDPDIVYAYGWNPFTEGSALMVRDDGSVKTIDELESELGDREAARTAMIESLEGKTIVTTLSTDMGKQLNDALASVGMDEHDVEFVDMDPDAGLAAYLSGTGDAYLGGVPQRSKALDEGMVVALAGTELAPPPINGLITKRGYVENNEEELLAFVNVMHRIIRYCNAETDACGTTVTDRLNEETAAGLTLDGFKEYWQNLELYAGNAAEAEQMILDEDGVAYWKDTWDSDNAYLVETGAIPAEVDASEHFLMPELWDAYAAEYGEDESDY